MTAAVNKYSEDQITRIVDTEVALFRESQLRADAIPQTITINRVACIKALKEMEAEIRKKHQEAVTAWRKANTMYADFIKKNPGSKAMQPPGNAPVLSYKIETVRAAIRAYSVVPDVKVRLSRNDWSQLFKDAGSAIADMRVSRDQYVASYSGTAASNVWLNAATTTG